MEYAIERKLFVPRPLEEVFEFFSQAGNLERITPPWLQFRIRESPGQMKEGALIEYALRVRGLPLRWLTRIERWNPPYEFVDVQLRGPYKLWRHTHRFRAAEGGTWIEDHVRYALPFGVLGRLVHRFQVARDVSAIFDYRTKEVQSLFPAKKQAGEPGLFVGADERT